MYNTKEDAKVLFVGGEFNDAGGKPSGYMKKLCEALLGTNKVLIPVFSEIKAYNGGTFEDLLNKALPEVVDSDIVFWLAHTLSDKPKLVERVKKINPKAILVCLARNDNGEDDILTQASKMLKYKANLMLEVKKVDDSKITASIFDPLCNCFSKDQKNISLIAFILLRRIWSIKRHTRVPSVSIGEYFIAKNTSEVSQFIEIAKNSAAKFSEAFHGVGNRFLGNLSFRCEGGFPSFKSDNIIYVSKRNIDKSAIDINGFVPINPNSLNLVEYYGENKPSVDTPIQLALYQAYPDMKFALHSHLNIKDAPFTAFPIPCGALEEIVQITYMIPDKKIKSFSINLLGHGSLVMSDNIDYIKNIVFEKRVLPTIFDTEYYTKEGMAF